MNNRVAMLSDFRNANYDTGNPALLGIWNHLWVFHYPNRGENPRNSIAGAEGDPIYVQVPFWVETAVVNGAQPILENATIAVVAIKAGKNDFIVESWSVNTGSACRSGNRQNINIVQTKGYTTYPNDPYNSASFAPDVRPAFNQGTKLGFLMQYGMVLRYDYWNSILTTAIGGTTCNNDINNDIQNVNNAWSNLSTKGWSFVLRFSANVLGYDGTITPFQAQTTMTVYPGGQVPDVGPAFAPLITYYDMNGILKKNIIAGGQTRIRVKYLANGVALPIPFTGYWGSMFADLFSGTPQSRRFASTEYGSESNSPFSAPLALLGDILMTADGKQILNAQGKAITAAPGILTYQSTKGNIILSYYAQTGEICMETIFDDSITQWGQKAQQIIMVPRLGFKVLKVLQTADGQDALTADGQQIIPS